MMNPGVSRSQFIFGPFPLRDVLKRCVDLGNPLLARCAQRDGIHQHPGRCRSPGLDDVHHHISDRLPRSHGHHARMVFSAPGRAVLVEQSPAWVFRLNPAQLTQAQTENSLRCRIRGCDVPIRVLIHDALRNTLKEFSVGLLAPPQRLRAMDAFGDVGCGSDQPDRRARFVVG